MSSSSSASILPTSSPTFNRTLLLDPLLCELILDLSTRSIEPGASRSEINNWFLSLNDPEQDQYATHESLEKIVGMYSNEEEVSNGTIRMPVRDRRNDIWHWDSTKLEAVRKKIITTENGRYSAVSNLKCGAEISSLPGDRYVLETTSLVLVLVVLTKDARLDEESIFCVEILRKVHEFYKGIILKSALVAVADLSINCQTDVLSNTLCLLPERPRNIHVPNIFDGWSFCSPERFDTKIYLAAALSVFLELRREQKTGMTFYGTIRHEISTKVWVRRASESVCTGLQKSGFKIYHAAKRALSLFNGMRTVSRRFSSIFPCPKDDVSFHRRMHVSSLDHLKQIDMSIPHDLDNTGGFVRGLAKHGVTFIAEDPECQCPIRATYLGRPSCFAAQELQWLFHRISTIQNTPSGMCGKMTSTRHVSIWAYILASVTFALCLVIFNPQGRVSTLERISDFVWTLSTLLLSVFGLIKLLSSDPNIILNVISGRRAIISVDDLIDYLELPALNAQETAISALKSVLAVYPDRLSWADSNETSFLREKATGSFKLLGGVHPKALAGAGLFVTDKFAFDIINGDVREVVDLGDGYIELKLEKLTRPICLSDIENLSDKMVI